MDAARVATVSVTICRSTPRNVLLESLEQAVNWRGAVLENLGGTFVGVFAELRNATIISIAFVRLSAWNNSAPKRPIFMII